MARESVGKEQAKRGTDKFERQGHTAGPYGNEPNKTPKGQAASRPRDLKP